MQSKEPTVFFHADDYGITLEQSKEILSLSEACGGKGSLNSISIFANSPIFDRAALLAGPLIETERLDCALHLNLVEGKPVCAPEIIPLLVGERGTFKLDFLGLLLGSCSPYRSELFRQLVLECRAQIARYIEVFPYQKQALQLDSHQHTHAIPLVFQALSQALKQESCKVSRLRQPVDPLALYKSTPGSNIAAKPTTANKGKIFLINALWKHCKADSIPWLTPKARNAPLFCGIALSGHMSQFDIRLLSNFMNDAAKQGRDLEILFHPVTVPPEKCLDPYNIAFAKACASLERDKEAAVLSRL